MEFFILKLEDRKNDITYMSELILDPAALRRGQGFSAIGGPASGGNSCLTL